MSSPSVFSETILVDGGFRKPHRGFLDLDEKKIARTNEYIANASAFTVTTRVGDAGDANEVGCFVFFPISLISHVRPSIVDRRESDVIPSTHP